MPLIITYSTGPGTTEVWGKPREGKVSGIVTATDQGTVGSSKLNLPDPAGDHVVRGLRRLYMSETDNPTDFEVIYDGYLGPREYGRDVEHILGSDRLVAVSLFDHNTLLSNYIIQGANNAANGVRPAETDLQRIAWLLGSPFTHPINDFGAIATSGVGMDAADLRGQNAGNTLRDCGLISGRQWFLYYDESQAGPNRIGLFYNKPAREVWTSTLRISNHPGDADGAVTFDCDSAVPPVQSRTPEHNISDVLIDYDGGQLFIACEEIGLTTRTDYYVKQLVVPAPNVKTLAMARRLGERLLRAHSSEEDSASVRLQLPSTKVGLIQPGHRIECRFDHFEPEYRAFTFWRVQELTWAQKSRKWYWVDLKMEALPPPVDSLCCISWPYNGVGDGAPGGPDLIQDWQNSGDDPVAGDAPPKNTPTRGLMTKVQTGTKWTNGAWDGIRMDGSGDIRIEWDQNFLWVYSGSGNTATWDILKNGAVVNTVSALDPGSGAHGWSDNRTGVYRMVLASLAVEPGDVIAARLTFAGPNSPPTSFFASPSGAGYGPWIVCTGLLTP